MSNVVEAPLNLNTLPGHLARRFHQISTALFDAEMRKAGIDLTSVQFAALIAVRDNPRIDQATLASIIALDRTTIGGVVDRLVDKGLMTRVTSDTDRRARVLTANERGMATIHMAEPAMRRAQSVLVGDLDRDETAELMRLMGKVVDALGDVTRGTR